MDEQWGCPECEWFDAIEADGFRNITPEKLARLRERHTCMTEPAVSAAQQPAAEEERLAAALRHRARVRRARLKGRLRRSA
ncbi:hypothetical protein GCM10020229_02460 [Kitasatospora albolonga]|uniref:hypothetical protein n=1 Tax=Kitasatospora albolonga TaxID=68173 RepID=UPI0031E88862